jgi:hypothetical protein
MYRGSCGECGTRIPLSPPSRWPPSLVVVLQRLAGAGSSGTAKLCHSCVHRGGSLRVRLPGLGPPERKRNSSGITCAGFSQKVQVAQVPLGFLVVDRSTALVVPHHAAVPGPGEAEWRRDEAWTPRRGSVPSRRTRELAPTRLRYGRDSSKSDTIVSVPTDMGGSTQPTSLHANSWGRTFVRTDLAAALPAASPIATALPVTR